MMQLNGYEDQHLHTTGSPDGRSTPEEMRDRARALGLRGITITDHCEAEQYFTHAYYRSVPQAYAQADALRRAGGPVEVRVGIEIGQPRSNPEVCAQLLAANDYDLVLASLHRLPDRRYRAVFRASSGATGRIRIPSASAFSRLAAQAAINFSSMGKPPVFV